MLTANNLSEFRDHGPRPLIDLFTPTANYFTNTWHGIPLFKYD
jgi:hypothetical protein